MQYKTGFVPEDLASTNVDTVASFKYIFNFTFIHIFVMHQFLIHFFSINGITRLQRRELDLSGMMF